MIEVAVSTTVAVITGGFVLTNKIYGRILELDKRIDSIELKIASAYVSKEDFGIVIDRLENHLIRIENKLDDVITNTDRNRGY